MKERELMQKNLARLLMEVDYKSCGSDIGDEIEDPVNPFMKRVFEKKLRRSSVASENMNPNIMHNFERNTDVDQYTRIDALISKGHECLERIKKNTIAHLQHSKIKKLASKDNRDQIIQNLEKSIQYVINYLQNRESEALNQKIAKNNSISHIQHYQCPTNTREDRQRIKTKQTQRYETRNRTLSGSMVAQSTHYKSNPTKSIYESVLEERKNRKVKKSRII